MAKMLDPPASLSLPGTYDQFCSPPTRELLSLHVPAPPQHIIPKPLTSSGPCLSHPSGLALGNGMHPLATATSKAVDSIRVPNFMGEAGGPGTQEVGRGGDPGSPWPPHNPHFTTSDVWNEV